MKREEEEDDDTVCLDESFFINDDYKVTTFTFGSQVLQLLCLQSASTDYDLTGQLVWPGAMLLNNYLSNNTNILQGCSIIELGSGVGITGILCSRFCNEIVLTDHNEEVLKKYFLYPISQKYGKCVWLAKSKNSSSEILLRKQILKKNIELQTTCGSPNKYAGLAAEKLEWGNMDDMSRIFERYPGGFDLILGADICFQQCSIPPLFTTVEKLLRLRGANRSKFILAYMSRAKIMDMMVVNEAVKHGLQVSEVDGTRSVVGNVEGVIFEIKLP